MLGRMRSAAVAEVVVHGLHLALFAAGLVGVGVLLWISRPRRTARTPEHEQARVEALRAAARAGTLADPGPASSRSGD
jgi:hypothetical protein